MKNFYEYNLALNLIPGVLNVKGLGGVIHYTHLAVAENLGEFSGKKLDHVLHLFQG